MNGDLGSLAEIARQRQSEFRARAAAHRLVKPSGRARRHARGGHESDWSLRLTEAELVVLRAELETLVAAHRRTHDTSAGTPITITMAR